ncbi:MAG: DUF4286 family protein, partial [Phaeodactylibacter sp.]|nr:DUF4286 family protein [Phaeodactylibacter sp.]MCB9302942.1 DUF4286 family protein [Lewinellaceae bacterium]HQU59510.1 DUF4286 family protein [Saprospiraceae bacterium]
MILYNVTIKIATDLHQDWLQWMKTVHIPDVMATGLFEEYRLLHILGEDESEGVTFAIQYFCPSLDVFREYQSKHAKQLQQQHSERYQNQYVAFRTLMEVL